MATRQDLQQWVVEALKANGGQGSIIDVCRHIWQVHEADLRRSGDLFYTWQYDVRWAAQKLRDTGVMRSMKDDRTSPWRLA
jgi:hypothetical protein